MSIVVEVGLLSGRKVSVEADLEEEVGLRFWIVVLYL